MHTSLCLGGVWVSRRCSHVLHVVCTSPSPSGCVAELEWGLVAQSTLSSSPLPGRASLHRSPPSRTRVPSEPHPSPLRAAPGSLPPAIFLVVVALCPPESYPLSHLPPNKSKRGEARPLISFNKKGGSHANTVGPAAGRLLVHAPPKHPAPRPASLLEGGHRCAPLCPLQGWVFSLKVKSLSQLKNGVSF